MKRPFVPERREVFKVTSIAGAGFLLGFHLPRTGRLEAFAQTIGRIHRPARFEVNRKVTTTLARAS